MQSENPIGQPFIQLADVESTNNYAMAKAQAQMAGHGTAWFALHQTKGKGQRGKAWKDEPGQNIILSILIEPKGLKPAESFKLSAVVATACHDFYSRYASDETKIKWPNDIYWKDRKAGGILIDNLLNANEWKFAIVGIGININQTSFPVDLPNPVSLKQITGKHFDNIEMANELCSYVNTRWQQLISGDFFGVLEDYNHVLYKAGKSVIFKRNETIFSVDVKSVNSAGELVLNDGTRITHGEVEWVGP